MKRKNIYESFMKLNWKSTNCTLLIYSVPGGTHTYFVRGCGTWGKESWRALV